MKRDIKSTWILILSLIFGNLLIALDVAIFVSPTGVIMGGSTGIALAFKHLFGLDTSIGVFLMNLIFLAIGSVAMGKKFFLSSVASSFLYPLFLALVQRLPLQQFNMGDHLLAAIMGGVLLGAGVGLIMRNGAGTGGTDGLALALNKWTHISTALLVSIVDIAILVLQAFFSAFDQILYGVVLTVVSSIILNRVILLGQSQLQLFIVSEKYQELRRRVLRELNMGATMMKIETGYTGREQEGLLTVIHPRELHAVTESIQRVDPNAFITIVQVKEVRGQGFTMDRVRYPEHEL